MGTCAVRSGTSILRGDPDASGAAGWSFQKKSDRCHRGKGRFSLCRTMSGTGRQPEGYWPPPELPPPGPPRCRFASALRAFCSRLPSVES